MVRRLAWVLTLLVALPVLAVLLLSLLPARWLATPTSSLLSAWLDGDVRVSQADLSFSGTQAILQLSDTQWQDHQGHFSAHMEQGELQYPWASLVRLSRDIHSLRIAGARLQLGQSLPDTMDRLQLAELWTSAIDEREALVERLTKWRIGSLLVDQLQILDSGTNRLLDVQLNGAASTLDPNVRTWLEVDGLLAGEPLQFSTGLPHLYHLLSGFPRSAEPTSLALSLDWGESQMQIDADVRHPERLQNLAASVAVEWVPGQALERIGHPSPWLMEAFSLSGNMQRERKDWGISDVTGRWGQSDFHAEMRFDPELTPPRVDASLSSAALHADELPIRLPADIAELWQVEGQWVDRLARLPEQLHGSVQWQADVISRESALGRIELGMLVDRQQVAVQLERLDLGSAQLQGEHLIRSHEGSVSTLRNLLIKRMPVDGDGHIHLRLADAGPEDASSELGAALPETGQATAPESSEPGSLASLAARVHLHTESEQASTGERPPERSSIRSASVEALAAGADVSTALAHLFENVSGERLQFSLLRDEALPPASPVECSWLQLELSGDNIDIATLAVMTPDSVLLGDGSWVGSTQDLALTLESHPRDPRRADDVRAWQSSGSPDQRQLDKASPVLTRQSAAAVLHEIVTPAAALMPFLDDQASRERNSPCSGLAGALPPR